MKNSFAILIGALVVLVLLVNMFCFQLRYDEVAVVTTFEKTGENSLLKEPALYFRLPFPIQKVTKYPRQLQVLETKIEEQKLRDGSNMTFSLYVGWRIDDALAFFKNAGTISKAEERIQSLARACSTIVARHNLEDYVNVDPAKVKIDAIQQEMQAQLAAELASYGVTVEQVGIRRMMVPEQVTTQVFQRMVTDREALAQKTLSQGIAEAERIKSNAKRIRDSMMTHANRFATIERAEGDKAAAAYYKDFAVNPELAAFLKRLEALPKMIGPGSTIVLPATLLELEQPTLPLPVARPNRPADGEKSVEIVEQR